MLLSSDILEERRLFSYEERVKILKRSNGICASCGKKLKTNTMTVDHIIPISRGGSNDMENLVALCEECNKEKGNLLCMPKGYYTALNNESEMRKMEKYVEEWFQIVKEQFDIEKFPLIAPKTKMQIKVGNTKKKKHTYIPSMILTWNIINTDYYEEIEAVTDIDIRYIRKTLPMVNDFYKESEEKYLPTVALYSLRKKTTDKILAVVAVEINLEHKHMNIWMPWSQLPKHYQGITLDNIVRMLFDTVIEIGKYDIDSYMLISTIDYKDAVKDMMTMNYGKRPLGYRFKYMSGESTIWKEYCEMLFVCLAPYNVKDIIKICPNIKDTV